MNATAEWLQYSDDLRNLKLRIEAAERFSRFDCKLNKKRFTSRFLLRLCDDGEMHINPQLDVSSKTSATSFPGSSVFLPREGTLISAGHVSTYTNQIRTEGGSYMTYCINTVYGGESCFALQTWRKLFVRDPAWPVLRFYPNFCEYEMMIESEVWLFSLLL